VIWPSNATQGYALAGNQRGATDIAEDFKQGAMFEKAADTHAADGTLLKIPLC
jgi:hypothetical protein